MGMYTGLRFSAKLNGRGLAAVGRYYMQMAKNVELAEQAGGWYQASELEGFREDVWGAVAEHHDIGQWEEVGRRAFIPNGGLAYMPGGWEQASELVDGVWNVCCSLKNYKGEIERFLHTTLPPWLAEPVGCEVLYEEWDEPEILMVTARLAGGGSDL